MSSCFDREELPWDPYLTFQIWLFSLYLHEFNMAWAVLWQSLFHWWIIGTCHGRKLHDRQKSSWGSFSPNMAVCTGGENIHVSTSLVQHLSLSNLRVKWDPVVYLYGNVLFTIGLLVTKQLEAFLNLFLKKPTVVLRLEKSTFLCNSKLEPEAHGRGSIWGGFIF